jgi:ATPase family associated with various cellular activities (AAA)
MTAAYYTTALSAEGKKTYKIHTLPDGGQEIANVIDLQGLQWRIQKGLHAKCKEMGITSLIQGGMAVSYSAEKEPIFNIRDLFPMTPEERIQAIGATTANAIVGDTSNCVVITGSPGVGKSFSVMEVLNKLDYDIHTCAGETMADGDEDTEPLINTSSNLAVILTGSITEAALFKILTQYPNAIIVFDDVADIFKSQNMISIILQATDSNAIRNISWMRAKKSKTIRFGGKIIILTNKKVSEFHPAIISRASGAVVSINLTKSEMMDLLTTRAASFDFLPRIDIQHKKDAIDFISEWINHPQIPLPNIRTLISTVKTFATELQVAMVTDREPNREFTKRSIIMAWLANTNN